jgi:hypothetical protein
MPQFYFRQYINGRQLAKDQRGRQFGSVAEARVYALCRAPSLISKTLRSTGSDTYLSTEISDGERTLFIIRGKVTSEKQ